MQQVLWHEDMLCNAWIMQVHKNMLHNARKVLHHLLQALLLQLHDACGANTSQTVHKRSPLDSVQPPAPRC